MVFTDPGHGATLEMTGVGPRPGALPHTTPGRFRPPSPSASKAKLMVLSSEGAEFAYWLKLAGQDPRRAAARVRDELWLRGAARVALELARALEGAGHPESLELLLGDLQSFSDHDLSLYMMRGALSGLADLGSLELDEGCLHYLTDTSGQVGVARFPVVIAGGASGALLEIRIVDGTDERAAALRRDYPEDLCRAIEAARTWVRSALHAHHADRLEACEWVIAPLAQEVRSSLRSTSVGMAALVAFASWAVGRSVDAGLVFTGSVVREPGASARLGVVSGVQGKLDVVARCTSGGRLVLFEEQPEQAASASRVGGRDELLELALPQGAWAHTMGWRYHLVDPELVRAAAGGLPPHLSGAVLEVLRDHGLAVSDERGEAALHSALERMVEASTWTVGAFTLSALRAHDPTGRSFRLLLEHYHHTPGLSRRRRAVGLLRSAPELAVRFGALEHDSDHPWNRIRDWLVQHGLLLAELAERMDMRGELDAWVEPFKEILRALQGLFRHLAIARPRASQPGELVDWITADRVESPFPLDRSEAESVGKRSDPHALVLLRGAQLRVLSPLSPFLRVRPDGMQQHVQVLTEVVPARRALFYTHFPRGSCERGNVDEWGELAELLAPEDLPAAARRNPYPGLASYTAADFRYFFGRDATATREVHHLTERGGLPWVLVTGPSGIGKSSFVGAGMLPRLPSRWSVSWLRPATSRGLVEGLFEALHAAGGPGTDGVFDLGRRQPLVSGELAASMSQRWFAGAYEEVASELRRALGEHDGWVLVIDQAEELLYAHPRDRDGLLWLLRRLTDCGPDEGPVARVVLTARTDRLDALLALREPEVPTGEDSPEDPPLAIRIAAPGLNARRLHLGPLDGRALMEVVLEPSRTGGLPLEPDSGLTHTLRTAFSGQVELGLVSLTLHELWQRLEGGPLDLAAAEAAYADLGGVGDVVKRAGAALERDLQHSGPWLRRLLLRLCRDGDHRNVLDLEAFAARWVDTSGLQEVVSAMVDSRLFRRDGPLLEVSHELVIRECDLFEPFRHRGTGLGAAWTRVEQGASRWSSHESARGTAGLWERLTTFGLLLDRHELEAARPLVERGLLDPRQRRFVASSEVRRRVSTASRAAGGAAAVFSGAVVALALALAPSLKASEGLLADTAEANALERDAPRLLGAFPTTVHGPVGPGCFRGPPPEDEQPVRTARSAPVSLDCWEGVGRTELAGWLDRATTLLAAAEGGTLARPGQRTNRVAQYLLPDTSVARGQYDDLLPALAAWRDRLELHQGYIQDMVAAQADPAWRTARKEIAGSKAYGGLQIVPQLGLLPLGFNAQGLYEFLHLPSGEAPRSASVAHPVAECGDRSTVQLVAEPETGIVLVLMPAASAQVGSAARDDFDGTAAAWDRYDKVALREQGHDDAAIDLLLSDRPSRDELGDATEVSLAPWFIGKWEITQAQWMRVQHGGPNPSTCAGDRIPHCDGNVEYSEGHERLWQIHPVENVSWSEAARGLLGIGLTLPTEAQWEIATRYEPDGEVHAWPWGSDLRLARCHANLADRTAEDHGGPPDWDYEAWSDTWWSHAPVHTFLPNGAGLHHTIGNVYEWVADCYGPYSEETRGGELRYAPLPGDGLRDVAPEDCHVRVRRGGSWYNRAKGSRSARRHTASPSASGYYLGIRAARPYLPAPSEPGGSGEIE